MADQRDLARELIALANDDLAAARALSVGLAHDAVAWAATVLASDSEAR